VRRSQRLTLTSLPDLPLIAKGDDLIEAIMGGLQRERIQLQSGDVLAITQKIISKAEGRAVPLSDVTPSKRSQELARQTGKDARLVELILRESKEVLRVRPGLIIVEHRLGFVCANAGVDFSNVGPEGESEDGVALLLPEDPDATAQRLLDGLIRATGAKVGVLITDSHGRAWREGAVGSSIGMAGLPALVDLRGTPDLFGRLLQTTQIGLADEIAAAASILMGQAGEGCPVVHIRGLPYPLQDGRLRDLIRPREKDLFR
jgi:coenzyme F420-0:L-glutamate ligase/coenzyme F420-1:gamma-L-glutamate ligase